MRTLTRLSFAVVAVACAAAHTLAQTPVPTEPEWVAVSPEGEGFTARMPKQPASAAQSVRANGLNASGTRYAAAADERTTFVVWSMKGSSAAGPLGVVGRTGGAFNGADAYLDAADELAWELLVTPELKRRAREQDSRERTSRLEPGMSYGGGFGLSGMPARSYYLRLEKEHGLVYVCAEGERVYVVAALGADERDARLKQFLHSFKLKSASGLPFVSGFNGLNSGDGDGIGPGRGGNVGGGGPAGGLPVDYGRPFKPAELAKKAVITAKPEPGFTESARKFNVTGTVRLRAVLTSSGKVEGISVIKWLPHGLTQRAIEAAKRIGFEPAQKDGRAVSQYVTLEYNFNIY